MLELLLSRGANVDSQTDCGKTALHIAVMQKLSEFLAPLKHFNVDANLQVVNITNRRYNIILLAFKRKINL